MDADTTERADLLARHPWVPRRRLTAQDYHRMGEAGILAPRERVELIEGELLEMAPIGSDHYGTVNGFAQRLTIAVGHRGVVAVQGPVRLNEYSEPEPDLAVLQPRDDFYRSALPQPPDVLLIVEVSSSSLAYDRRVKLALYARHGIPESWIVDVAAGEVEVHTEPAGETYAGSVRIGRDGVLRPTGLPGLDIALSGLLG